MKAALPTEFGYADSAQIGGVGKIVNRVASERVTVPEIDRVPSQRRAGLPNVHERNFKIKSLAFSRYRRFANVGAHVAPHDAAALEDIGQRAMRIVRPVARERPLGLGRVEEALAPVGGSGDRLCLRRLGISGPCLKPKALIALADTTEAKARWRSRNAPRSCCKPRLAIYVVELCLGSSQPPARIGLSDTG